MQFSHAKSGTNFKSAGLIHCLIHPATDVVFESFDLAGDLRNVQLVDVDTSTLILVPQSANPRNLQ